MPSVAQQDYKIIEIVSLSEATTKETAEIRKAVENGIIYDCIIRDVTNNSEGRVIGVDYADSCIVVWDALNLEPITLAFAE